MEKTMAITGLFTSKLGMNILHISRKMSSDASDVIVQNVQDKGVIILNRPKALNTLNLSMVQKIYSVLKEWEQKKTLVLVKGAGGKAFCAGGDVVAVAQAGLKGDKLSHEFFKQQYSMNGFIASYKIPYIAFIDGIVMGAGVGLSVHGTYRVATEKTLFAMPETQIGFFSDVGGSYFLSRLGQLGTYLALTGQRLKGSDVFKAGIATHYCDSQDLEQLEQALLNSSNKQDAESTLNKFNKNDNTEFSLSPVLEKINYCFSAETMEDVYSRLRNDGSTWAKDTLKLLNKMSPTSMKVTLKELQLGKELNLPDCLQMEYRIAVNCLNNTDCYEGARALLIDKDQNPKWNPATLSEVSNIFVDSHFSKVSEELEIKNTL